MVEVCVVAFVGLGTSTLNRSGKPRNLRSLTNKLRRPWGRERDGVECPSWVCSRAHGHWAKCSLWPPEQDGVGNRLLRARETFRLAIGSKELQGGGERALPVAVQRTLCDDGFSTPTRV